MDNTVQTENTIIPERSHIFSGSALKLIALISMIIDHTAFALIYYIPLESQLLFTLGEKTVTWYSLMRGIGRLAFPLYCFLLSEGFVHTHDRRKYGRNLLVFALISELPWNLLHAGTWLYPGSQNVFFTLFLGFLGITVLDELPSLCKKFAALGTLLIAASFLHADYGVRGFALPVLLYALRRRKEALLKADRPSMTSYS